MGMLPYFLPTEFPAPANLLRFDLNQLLRKKREVYMIRKLKSGEYRLYSRKKNPKTGKHRNLGTFGTREKAEAHERAVQYFKRSA